SIRRGSLLDGGHDTRRFRTAAEEQHRADWPDLAVGHPGTRVQITFDARNADVTLVTNASFGLPRLLQEARQLASALSMPEADYITFQGVRTVAVDLELNDYLRRQRARTDFDLDLATLAA